MTPNKECFFKTIGACHMTGCSWDAYTDSVTGRFRGNMKCKEGNTLCLDEKQPLAILPSIRPLELKPVENY